MKCPHPAPDFGPLPSYPSAAPTIGAWWRLAWNVLCVASRPLRIAEVLAVVRAEDPTAHAVTITNLVQAAASAGKLEKVQIPAQSPAGRKHVTAYQLPTSLTQQGEMVL